MLTVGSIQRRSKSDDGSMNVKFACIESDDA